MLLEFLQLRHVAARLLRVFLVPNFAETINTCKLNLTQLNPVLLQDMADCVPLDQVLLLRPRQSKDLFINSLLKLIVDSICNTTIFLRCNLCNRLMTKE